MTSGLVVLAKSKEAASVLSKEIRDKSTKKTYLARVKGKFPLNLDKFKQLNSEDILNLAIDDDDNDDDDDKNDNDKNKSSNNNKSSTNNSKNNNNNSLTGSKAKEQERIKQQQQQNSKKRDRNGTMKIVVVEESDLPPRYLRCWTPYIPSCFLFLNYMLVMFRHSSYS